MIRALMASLILATATAQAAAQENTPLQEDAGSLGLVLPAPSGYCELSSTHPADRAMLIFGQIMFTCLLSMFADCGQLDAIRAKSGTLSASEYVTPNYAAYRIFLLPESEPSPMSRDGFDEWLADVFGDGDADRRAPASLPEWIERAEIDIDRMTLAELGPRNRDDPAAFGGNLTRSLFADTGGDIDADVFAITLIGGRIISLQLRAPYEGQQTFEHLLEQQRINMDRLIAAN